MYKWEDFLTKLANNTVVSETHKLLIKQKFLQILQLDFPNMIPQLCKIVLAKTEENNPYSKNSLFVSIGSENRTSSITEVPLLVENQLNKFFENSNIKYIYEPNVEKFIILIQASEVPTKGVKQQRKQEQ